MKKRMMLFVFICGVCMMLCGCANDLMMSWEYKQMEDISVRASSGEVFTKQALFDELGYPYYYTDLEGEKRIGENQDEQVKERLFQSDVQKWSYMCYKYPDPAGPYALKVYFDEYGNSLNMTFKTVPENWELEEPKINERILFE